MYSQCVDNQNAKADPALQLTSDINGNHLVVSRLDIYYTHAMLTVIGVKALISNRCKFMIISTNALRLVFWLYTVSSGLHWSIAVECYFPIIYPLSWTESIHISSIRQRLASFCSGRSYHSHTQNRTKMEYSQCLQAFQSGCKNS